MIYFKVEMGKDKSFIIVIHSEKKIVCDKKGFFHFWFYLVNRFQLLYQTLRFQYTYVNTPRNCNKNETTQHLDWLRGHYHYFQ